MVDDDGVEMDIYCSEYLRCSRYALRRNRIFGNRKVMTSTDITANRSSTKFSRKLCDQHKSSIHRQYVTPGSW